MRPVIKLAYGLAAGTLLLLGCASATFAADPLVTLNGSANTSSVVKAVAKAGTSSGTVTLRARRPHAGRANGSATVALGAGAPTTADGADANATVALGAGAPTTADGANGSATVALGAGAPTTADGANGSALVNLGAGAPSSVGDPTSTAGAVSSGFGRFLSVGNTAAGTTTGSAPGAPAVDGAGLARTFGRLLASGASGGAGGSGGSGGAGDAAATPGEAGAAAVPETSMLARALEPTVGFPVLAILLGLLAGGLMARRRSVRSAR